MNLIKRWNAYMGPKDERLVAENNRCMRVGYYVLLAGTCLAAYYAIMVNQVADTTSTPVFTAAGQGLSDLGGVLAFVILASALTTLALEMKAGVVDEHVRMATIDQVPWDFCVIIGLVTGAVLGVATAGMRMLVEWQIVGADRITWGGDIAMGVVFFVMAFVLGTFCTAAFFASAIKQRKLLEEKLED